MTSWDQRLEEIDSLVAGNHHKQAVQEIGSVLEGLLRELYRQVVPSIPPLDQAGVSSALEKIGKNKPIDDLTLGQLVGLFRDAMLFSKAEAVLGRKLQHLSSANFNTLISIRNRATHKGDSVKPSESRYFGAQVRVFAEEIGLLEAPQEDSSTPAEGIHLQPWVEVVQLHPDVLSEEFSEDMFALDLGPLADGNPNVPAVYRHPGHFFEVSYLTSGLRALLEDVLGRLAGGHGSRVLKLVTPFGGGKSHTLAALLHATKDRDAINVVPDLEAYASPGKVRTAVFDGQFFDATSGKQIPNEPLRAKTMWGWIAASLGGKAGYEQLRAQDEARIAPGGDEIMALLGNGANLILLDEVLQYLISAGGVKIEQTTLRDETLTFLQRLTTSIGNTPRTVLVFSLQSSKRESLEYTSLLQTVDHLAARKDQRREPVEGNEILAVIQRRLLSRIPVKQAADAAASAYQRVITQMRRAYASSSADVQMADEEGIALRDRVRASYPFHPALIDIMRERWAAIPDFQRTRGALRFLAACLRASHREGKSRTVLSPGDVPIHDAEVRLAFFKEVGQQSDFQAVLEHDLVGANARARRIDERRAKESPLESLRRPAVRLATAILMYSFGGLRREGNKELEALPPGVTESELLAACVGPDLDSTTALACLKELREQCLYLHYDGARYCFKKDPNVTLLLEQEAEAVGRDERRVRDRIRELLEARLGGHRSAIVWPATSLDVPDRDPAFIVSYLPLEFAGKPRDEQEELARGFFEKSGDKLRVYRNGVAVAVPSGDQVEILRRSVRYLIAADQVRAKARGLNLTDEQRSQLREREATEAAGAESALLKLYTEVWLPRAEGGAIGIEKIAAGGRPLQATLNEKKHAMIHERIMELLTNVQPRVFSSLTPGKIIELFHLGEGEQPTPGVRTSEVVDGFYSFLGFTRMTTGAVLKKAIARGVREEAFGYASGARPTLGDGGQFEILPSKTRFGVALADDEVDLETGFLMSAAAVPREKAPDVSLPVPAELGGDRPPTGVTDQGRKDDLLRTIDLSFAADRNALFTAWNAIANLADMAGEVSVTVHAESQAGFEKAKLRNGVIEPLREADLID